jgi:hypothetical protein
MPEFVIDIVDLKSNPLLRLEDVHHAKNLTHLEFRLVLSTAVPAKVNDADGILNGWRGPAPTDANHRTE